MRNQVTVIPADGVVIVDGAPLWVDIAAPAGMHALQWRDGAGEIEWDGKPNEPFPAADYGARVAPFVALWEAERARLEAAANKPPALEEIIADYDNRIDERLESFARQLYSKGLVNAIGYMSSNVPVWRLEAGYLNDMRDATLMTAFNYMNEVLPQVESGQRAVPTWEEVEAILPPLAWPEGSRGYVAGSA